MDTVAVGTAPGFQPLADPVRTETTHQHRADRTQRRFITCCRGTCRGQAQLAAP